MSEITPEVKLIVNEPIESIRPEDYNRHLITELRESLKSLADRMSDEGNLISGAGEDGAVISARVEDGRVVVSILGPEMSPRRYAILLSNKENPLCLAGDDGEIAPIDMSHFSTASLLTDAHRAIIVLLQS